MTLTIFSDFECGFCAQVAPVITKLERRFPGQLKIQFKHHPLSFHRRAKLAHLASIAAHKQDKFWEMHDLLFSNQRQLDRADLLGHAKKLGLDEARFTHDMESAEAQRLLDADLALGEDFEVNGTPSFQLGAKAFSGAKSFEYFERMIQAELGNPAQSSSTLQTTDAKPSQPTYRLRGQSAASNMVEIFWDASSRYTKQTLELIAALELRHPNNLQFVFRHRPHAARRHAAILHQALESSGQAANQMWRMLQLLAEHAEVETLAALKTLAQTAGLNIKALEDPALQQSSDAVVQQDLAEATRREVRGAPVFFVNGKRIDGIQPLSFFEAFLQTASPPSGAQ